jgi:hypothetical protein
MLMRNVDEWNGDHPMTRKVVLRNVKNHLGTRYLDASLTPEGDLVIAGQDLGKGVEQAFGCQEYEWAWTIRAPDIAALLQAMGTTTDVLSALKERFSGEKAAGIGSFLEAHAIPHDFWSRIGD